MTVLQGVRKPLLRLHEAYKQQSPAGSPGLGPTSCGWFPRQSFRPAQGAGSVCVHWDAQSRAQLFNIPEEKNIFQCDFFSHCKLFFGGLLLELVSLPYLTVSAWTEHSQCCPPETLPQAQVCHLEGQHPDPEGTGGGGLLGGGRSHEAFSEALDCRAGQAAH